MPKKISITLLFTVVVAIVALFAATEVIAGAIDLPTETECGGYTIYVDEGNTLFMQEPYVFTDTVETAQGDQYPCKLWTFEINCEPSDLERVKKLTFFLPSSPDDTIQVVGMPDGTEYADFCLGGPCDWGEGICNGKVLTVPTSWIVDTKRAWFGTIRGTDGLVSAGVYWKYRWWGNVCDCDTGIKGPGYLAGKFALEPEPEVLTFTKTIEGKTCKLQVQLAPEFEITVVEGECYEDLSAYDITELTLGLGKAIDLQDGWFVWGASPARYCYYNRAIRKYSCVTY